MVGPDRFLAFRFPAEELRELVLLSSALLPMFQFQNRSSLHHLRPAISVGS